MRTARIQPIHADGTIDHVGDLAKPAINPALPLKPPLIQRIRSTLRLVKTEGQVKS